MNKASNPLTWQKAGQSEDGLRDFFLPVLADIGAGVIVQDAEHNYIFLTNLPEIWRDEAPEAPSDDAIFGEEIGRQLAGVRDTILKTGDRGRLEVMPAADKVYEFRILAVTVEGRGLYFITSIIDRSEERHRQRLMKTLLREVSHRSKNLLAIIQSIALQTARHAFSPELFLHKFLGRLHSLSQSQDLITDSGWRGAHFRDLVRQQTERYLGDSQHLVRIHGDNVLLSPNAALHVGLALHELVVNAASHGSLMRSAGVVNVTCTQLRLSGQSSLEIVWDELLDADLAADGAGRTLKARFGSTVLERVVPASVNGKANYAIGDGRISYRLVFPIESGE